MEKEIKVKNESTKKDKKKLFLEGVILDEETELSNFVRKNVEYGNYRELLKLLKKGVSFDGFEKAIEEAAIKRIKICVDNGWYNDLLDMWKDENLPDYIRERARENVYAALLNFVEKNVNAVFYKNLLQALDNKELNEKEKKVIKEKLEKACISFIEKCVRYGLYEQLIDMSKNEKIEEKIKKIAEQNIEKAAIKWAEICIDYKWKEKLNEIVNDERLKKEIREKIKEMLKDSK